MGTSHPTFRLLCLLAAIALASAAQAQWNDDGNLVCGAANNQEAPRLISDGAGGAVIVWEDGRSYGDIDLYIQRVDGGGGMQWTSDGAVVCTADAAQIWPDLSGDGSGGAFLTWSDYRLGGTTYSAYVQHMDGTGTRVWTADGKWLNTGASNAHILADNLGGAYVVWREAATYPASIAMQRISTLGNAVWYDYVSLGSGDMPRLVADGAGGVVVGWAAYQTSNYWVRGQRLDQDGDLLWPNATVSPSYGCQFNAPLASDGTGGAIWAYQYYSDVIAQRRDGSGALSWGAAGIDPAPALGTASSPQVISDGAGGAIVVFEVGGVDIYVNRILANGSLAWGTGAVALCTDAALQQDPQLAPDGYGGAYVVWEDHRDDATSGGDLYAQHLDADGTPQWAAGGVPVCTATGLQNAALIVATGDHNAIVAWQDGRGGTTDLDIYAQMIRFDGSIGPLPFQLMACYPTPVSIDVPWSAAISATFNDLPLMTIEELVVHGSLSGLHPGRLAINKVTNTVTLNPADFLPGEVVTVMLTDGITSKGGEAFQPTGWSFTGTALGAEGEFLAAVSFPVQNRPMALCAADLDDDGDLDLVSANYDVDSISIRRGIGDGTFAAAVNLATGDRPHGVVAADLDLDGDLELVTADYGASQVTVFANDGAGHFSVPASFPTGGGPQSVFAIDIDGDGDLDLATANLVDDTISVLKNTGMGSFGAPDTYAAGDNPCFISGADLDGDGFFDLVTANIVSDDVSVFLNKGTGMLKDRVDIPTGNNMVSVAPADVDGDGDYDLVAAAALSNQVVVLPNQGDGTFGTATNWASVGNPNAALAADLDGDGDLDLAHCNSGMDDIWVRLNDGSGNFGAQTAYGVGDFPNALVAADFNGDGALDLASANRSGNDITVLLNKDWVSAVGPEGAPTASRLAANVPNPFNPRTRIDYTVQRDGPVRLVVYDARGREVVTLVDEPQTAGARSVTWDGRDRQGNPAASGVYLYKLTCGKEEAVRRMVLVR